METRPGEVVPPWCLAGERGAWEGSQLPDPLSPASSYPEKGFPAAGSCWEIFCPSASPIPDSALGLVLTKAGVEWGSAVG